MSLMSSKDALAIQLFDSLPPLVKRDLRKRGVRNDNYDSITGVVEIQEMIRGYFVRVGGLTGELLRDKAKRGYCAGKVTCLTYLGKNPDHKICDICRKEQRDYSSRLEGEGRRNKRSEYGSMRMKQRENERAEKEGRGRPAGPGSATELRSKLKAVK